MHLYVCVQGGVQKQTPSPDSLNYLALEVLYVVNSSVQLAKNERNHRHERKRTG